MHGRAAQRRLRMKHDWSHLLSLAQREVADTLRELPEELRGPASALPVTYERRPNQAILDDGYEDDLLGLFIGSPIYEPGSSPLPPQIILFLENLADFTEGDSEAYLEEVHITYLHELGHYLGLEEDDLDARGLL
jgi:predicted Zn-dependent protease with MMP-like domain